MGGMKKRKGTIAMCCQGASLAFKAFSLDVRAKVAKRSCSAMVVVTIVATKMPYLGCEKRLPSLFLVKDFGI